MVFAYFDIVSPSNKDNGAVYQLIHQVIHYFWQVVVKSDKAIMYLNDVSGMLNRIHNSLIFFLQIVVCWHLNYINKPFILMYFLLNTTCDAVQRVMCFHQRKQAFRFSFKKSILPSLYCSRKNHFNLQESDFICLHRWDQTDMVQVINRASWLLQKMLILMWEETPLLLLSFIYTKHE